jgi:hypothetical protein
MRRSCHRRSTCALRKAKARVWQEDMRVIGGPRLRTSGHTHHPSTPRCFCRRPPIMRFARRLRQELHRGRTGQNSRHNLKFRETPPGHSGISANRQLVVSTERSTNLSSRPERSAVERPASPAPAQSHWPAITTRIKKPGRRRRRPGSKLPFPTWSVCGELHPPAPPFPIPTG